MFPSRLLCLLCVVGAASLVAADAVKIDSGLLAGVEEDGIRVYRGIPYAAPPVGALRWRAPQPAAAWKGVRQGDKFGPACLQPGTQQMSEDCLSLNVWAPNVWVAARQDAKPLPVMVWIHGGAFRTGAGSLPVYDGGALARQGVVLVTINYRLGDFGLFAHPALKEGGGNLHLMDQIAALQWVRRNIGAFGGDPQQVTIFGESAGGSSVLYLMISPEARGLFHRAIVESGGGAQEPAEMSRLEATGQRIAQDLGVAAQPDPVRALRNLPAATILQRPRTAAAQLGEYQPVMDGKFVVGGPMTLFQAGKQAPVPLLIGANNYEATLMRGFGITSSTALKMYGGDMEALRRAYREDSKGDPDLMAAYLFGDALFVAPARFLAGAMGHVKQPAWLYYYSYVLEKRRDNVPGAGHAAEISLVFNNLRIPSLAAIVTGNDRKMAERVSAYWVRFAKTGNPGPDWPGYTRAAGQSLELGQEITVRKHLRKEQLDILEKRWRNR